MPRIQPMLDRLSWLLIHAGLFGAGLGLWLSDAHVRTGWSLPAGGATAVVAGVVLIGVRARYP